MTRSLTAARKRSPFRSSVLADAIAFMGLSGCGDGMVNTGGNVLPPVSPGDVLPLDSTVRVGQSGMYTLPANAVSLRTRCFGSVTVTFTPPSGQEQNNTCESADGSANQTNDVTEVTTVEYTLAPGAFADVTAG